MPEPFGHIDFWIIAVVIIATVWYQKKVAVANARVAGFTAGAALGMLYGGKHATEMLTSGKYSLLTDQGAPVYANEVLFDEVLGSAREHLIKNPGSLFLYKD